MKSLFHVSYHVTDLETSRNFYGNILGCKEGRTSETYVDYDFFGHQISLHKGVPFPTTRTGKVGDHEVLMPHIGLVLHLDDWFAMADRLALHGVQSTYRRLYDSRANLGSSERCFSWTPVATRSRSKGSRTLKVYLPADWHKPSGRASRFVCVR